MTLARFCDAFSLLMDEQADSIKTSRDDSALQMVHSILQSFNLSLINQIRCHTWCPGVDGSVIAETVTGSSSTAADGVKHAGEQT